jgi:hypothetical protein
MARTSADTIDLLNNTLRSLTATPAAWTDFLRAAGRLYKYPFPDQVLIYAQRPDATACADYAVWNTTMRRYVRRGAKGIALIGGSGDAAKPRYVFDVSDTGVRRDSRRRPSSGRKRLALTNSPRSSTWN